MRILKHELRKLIRFPLMWGLLSIFITFDIYLIFTEVGYQDYQNDLQGVYDVITGYKTQGEYYEFYFQYKENYSDIYDGLDMQDMKQMKEDLANYYPTGSYKKFIDGNYDKLQKRVEQIKSEGNDSGDFYPGDVFQIHQKLYAVLKCCIVEMLIIMCFSVLYLMDFERVNRTEDLVFANQTGRRNMRIKLRTGLLGGVGFCVVILAVNLIIFFALVPMKGLWNTPVSSYMVMESSGLWEYPFITFVRLTIWQELALNIMTELLLVLLFGVIAGAVQFFINNSYITMLCMGAGFIGLLWLTYTVQVADWIKTAVCLNPAVLWLMCGRWFIENDISLSFAWSEFLTLGAWGVMYSLISMIGWKLFNGKDM